MLLEFSSISPLAFAAVAPSFRHWLASVLIDGDFHLGGKVTDSIEFIRETGYHTIGF